MKITFVVAMLAATFALNSVSAQAQNVRVRGTIDKLDGNNLAVKSRDGAELKLVLKDNVRIGGVVKAPSPTSRLMPTWLSPRGHDLMERSRRSSCASFPPGSPSTHSMAIGI
jgi:hypothetical protein